MRNTTHKKEGKTMEKEKEVFVEVLNENGYRYTYINSKLVHVWDCINHITVLDKREEKEG